MKKGFGLLEVMLAAVVLGFLIVGLNKLQMGNREVILRVRARDAANFIAQYVLDSLSSVGLNSIYEDPKAKTDCKSTKSLVYCDTAYKYTFDNKSEIPYIVEVDLLDKKYSIDSTNFTKTDTNVYAKNIQATVKWKFKNSEQKIEMAKVVR